MGAHETLFNHKLNSEWNGKEPTVLMRLCNHHKLNTYGTERNGADCNWKPDYSTERNDINIYIYVTVWHRVCVIVTN